MFRIQRVTSYDKTFSKVPMASSSNGNKVPMATKFQWQQKFQWQM